jgi:hypothetical protein
MSAAHIVARGWRKHSAPKRATERPFASQVCANAPADKKQAVLAWLIQQKAQPPPLPPAAPI